MRKYIIAHIIIGFVLTGAADGMHRSKCPNDGPFPVSQLVAGVTMWPIAIVSITLFPKQPLRGCESQ